MPTPTTTGGRSVPLKRGRSAAAIARRAAKRGVSVKIQAEKDLALFRAREIADRAARPLSRNPQPGANDSKLPGSQGAKEEAARLKAAEEVAMKKVVAAAAEKEAARSPANTPKGTTAKGTTARPHHERKEMRWATQADTADIERNAALRAQYV